MQTDEILKTQRYQRGRLVLPSVRLKGLALVVDEWLATNW